MVNLDLDTDNIGSALGADEVAACQPEVDRWHQALETGKGAGAEFLGWLHLPSQTTPDQLGEIRAAARRLQDQCEIFVCIGIGGSYLGAKAAMDFAHHAFLNQLPASSRGFPQIHFAGQNISSDYLADLMEVLANKAVCFNVISKSGTTTEPAIAFRLLKGFLEKEMGVEESRKRIVVTTDQRQGALKAMAETEGYQSFVIPDDVGGRFSVLTPVGLLPMAVGGLDIEEVIAGARECEARTTENSALDHNSAYRYAVIRNLLYRKGKTIELMAAFHPALKTVVEWWKQLAGESEGKAGGGIFPASAEFSADLHSLGQWVQAGNRIIFETFIRFAASRSRLEIPAVREDRDGLNYLAGKTLDEINEQAWRGTAEAHLEGGVPNMTLTLKDRSAYGLGQLFYFFERAIALSAYLAGVNPFDQPGVELYKTNMFRLLNKPGYKKGNA
ncbi:MAG: glucose-6-phosphate isomerase [Nitrospinaceae bacterium]|nr:glucose-6-phosphate isomerase [Nitrospinaceae bacterium]NIR57276.1 glucose-6-phosphate isomerase [Nitrospinaceae bacterium]NIS87728.1 glucose-6-phosphate isomerase [Nitrospinaceae bacterium]NIT84594.1 glucose-6-phosphate isomerase [Nitrospinaceae bacterium]NIU46777.1 glucose-6-phosphate isomerase [Nitrospinaceae bacterium]